jgi:hypothetical protein
VFSFWNIERLIGSLLVGYLESDSSSKGEKLEVGSDTIAAATSHSVSFPVPDTQPNAPLSSNTGEIPSLLRSYKLSNSDIEDDKNPWEK